MWEVSLSVSLVFSREFCRRRNKIKDLINGTGEEGREREGEEERKRKDRETKQKKKERKKERRLIHL